MYKARSRRTLYRFHQRMTRMKMELLVLSALLLIYCGVQILTHAFILNPVQSLADTKVDVVYIDKPVEVPVEVDRHFTSEKQQIMAYMIQKFGDRSADAITIISQCENHDFNPEAINVNHNGSIDVGVMQINVDPKDHTEVEALKHWKHNIDRGYEKYHAAGNTFRAWTCATVIGEKNYLGK